jgi:hypothetical protein
MPYVTAARIAGILDSEPEVIRRGVASHLLTLTPDLVHALVDQALTPMHEALGTTASEFDNANSEFNHELHEVVSRVSDIVIDIKLRLEKIRRSLGVTPVDDDDTAFDLCTMSLDDMVIVDRELTKLRTNVPCCQKLMEQVAVVGESPYEGGVP